MNLKSELLTLHNELYCIPFDKFTSKMYHDLLFKLKALSSDSIPTILYCTGCDYLNTSPGRISVCQRYDKPICSKYPKRIHICINEHGYR
jgi:hypothetical protein